MAQLPTQSQFGDYSDWPGRDVLDSGGQRLGGVREIYLDRETGRPEWVLVDVDDSEARFVPLADAGVESSSIRVAHSGEKIRSAPGIGAEPRIDQSEERRLYAYYGVGYDESDSSSGLPSDDAPPPPSGGGERDTPSKQARAGDASDGPAASRGAFEQPAAFSAPRDAGELSDEAPRPADPPSPAELRSARIPEPPAASDRATEYETAPFGAVEPPTGEEPTGDDTSPAAAYALPAEEPSTSGADDPATPEALAPPIETPSSLTPPTTSLGADVPSADTPVPAPPVTADVPVADQTPTPQTGTGPSWASTTPPPSTAEPVAAALERVKRSPKQIALATSAAAVLFFIVRRLR